MSTRNKTDKPPEHAAIIVELWKVLNKVKCLIERNNVSLEDAQRMAGFIAEVRRLLGEWSGQKSRFAPACAIADQVRILNEQSLELEGLVKEIRNGLERKRRESGYGNE
jgi:hypothetical protein